MSEFSPRLTTALTREQYLEQMAGRDRPLFDYGMRNDGSTRWRAEQSVIDQTMDDGRADVINAMVKARTARGTADHPIIIDTSFLRASCGTHSGYVSHHKRSEPSCDPCREAHSAYQREQKRKRRAA